MLFKKYINNVKSDLKEEWGYLKNDLMPALEGKKNLADAVAMPYLAIIMIVPAILSFILCLLRYYDLLEYFGNRNGRDT